MAYVPGTVTDAKFLTRMEPSMQSQTSTQASRTLPVAVLVTASVVLSLCLGLRNSLGLFLSPMAAELGITAGFFGFALAVQNLVWGLAQPFIGALADRIGSRPALVGAALIYAVGLLIMAASGDPTIGLGLGGGVMVGIGVAGTGFGVLLGAVSRAVPPERRSWAVGVVSAAGSLGTIVIAPLGQTLIATLGWRAALLAFALIAVAMAFVSLGIGGRVSPPAISEPGLPLRAALREVMAHPGFLMMTAAFFACGFQLTHDRRERGEGWRRTQSRLRQRRSIRLTAEWSGAE